MSPNERTEARVTGKCGHWIVQNQDGSWGHWAAYDSENCRKAELGPVDAT